ncbi:hypothetical protein R6Q57_012825 [Mikania cordata]
MNEILEADLEATNLDISPLMHQQVIFTFWPKVDAAHQSNPIPLAFAALHCDKAVNQLDKAVNSKLEATVSRQIQAQFQTSGKQALQEALRSNMEASVVPAFETSCKLMFEQVDATFNKGMIEHTTAIQQQVESMHSPLAFALRDTINSASSLSQTLSSEFADGQRKLMALAVAGANSKSANPLIGQLSNGPSGVFHEKIEAPVDPTKELSRLAYEHKFEEAFTAALQRSDVRIVSWLCSQVHHIGFLCNMILRILSGIEAYLHTGYVDKWFIHIQVNKANGVGPSTLLQKFNFTRAFTSKQEFNPGFYNWFCLVIDPYSQSTEWTYQLMLFTNCVYKYICEVEYIDFFLSVS